MSTTFLPKIAAVSPSQSIGSKPAKNFIIRERNSGFHIRDSVHVPHPNLTPDLFELQTPPRDVQVTAPPPVGRVRLANPPSVQCLFIILFLASLLIAFVKWDIPLPH